VKHRTIKGRLSRRAIADERGVTVADLTPILDQVAMG
jgi:hypothetical protein